MTDALVASLLFVIPALLGIRATWRLWRIYWFNHESRKQEILLGLALTSTIITGAASFYGVLAIRRLLGFEPLDWTAPISLALAAAVLFLPAALERMVNHIATRRERGEHDG